MKKLIFLNVAFLLWSLIVYSQHSVDNNIKNKIDELHGMAVDTILGYQFNCSGKPPVAIGANDTAKCHPIYVEYLLWKNKGKSVVQRFDECYNYKPIVIDKDLAMNVIKKHLSAIIRESIKPVSYKIVDNTGHAKFYNELQTHSCIGDFTFYINNKIIKKRVDEFDLSTRTIDDSKYKNGKEIIIKRANVNYNANNNTYLKQLSEFVKNEIESIYPEKKYQ